VKIRQTELGQKRQRTNFVTCGLDLFSEGHWILSDAIAANCIMPRARGRQALAARKLQSWMAFKGALGRCRRRCGTLVSSHPVRFRGSPQNRPAGKLIRQPVAAVRAGTSVDSRMGSGPSSSETRACAGLRRPIAAPSARLKGRSSPAVVLPLLRGRA
jgi:hypothetical protein